MNMKPNPSDVIAQFKRQAQSDVDALMAEYPGASRETMEAIYDEMSFSLKFARRTIARVSGRRPELDNSKLIQHVLDLIDLSKP